MSRSIVLKSFAELGEVLNLDELPDGPAPEAAEPSERPPALPDGPVDLAALLAELEGASATLATVVRQDQEARSLALRDLERYDALAAQQREAEQAHERARQVRLEAERLADAAFAEEARASATRVAEMAARAEAAAAHLVAERRQAAEALAAECDLERLLQERRRQQEAEQAKAAEAERSRRLSGALAQARALLEAGRFEEARELLGPAATEYPDNPEMASLHTIMAQRELAVKVDAAEEALWLARREYRREPASAVAQLVALDLDGLPEPISQQVFGEWARACSRLCRERGLAEPLRYAPDPGRGAVLARDDQAGRYVVVSALGMGPEWQAGRAVAERTLRRARPLR